MASEFDNLEINSNLSIEPPRSELQDPAQALKLLADIYSKLKHIDNSSNTTEDSGLSLDSIKSVAQSKPGESLNGWKPSPEHQEAARFALNNNAKFFNTLALQGKGEDRGSFYARMMQPEILKFSSNGIPLYSDNRTSRFISANLFDDQLETANLALGKSNLKLDNIIQTLDKEHKFNLMGVLAGTSLAIASGGVLAFNMLEQPAKIPTPTATTTSSPWSNLSTKISETPTKPTYSKAAAIGAGLGIAISMAFSIRESLNENSKQFSDRMQNLRKDIEESWLSWKQSKTR